MSNRTFRDDFFWGAATAAYQVEGGIENTDWAEAARAKRVPPCGHACDHYHRFEEDFDIAKELGHTAHRFSIEWARIEPEEGVFDYDEIEHYRKVILALRTRNLEPIMTLWHFTLPLWFSQSGGFERKDASEKFARYAQFVARELGEKVTYISTMNEPMVFAGLGWLKGNWPPFKMFGLSTKVEFTNSGNREMARPEKSIRTFFLYQRVVRNLAQAHNEAYKEIKKVNVNFNVSLVKHVVAYDSNNQLKNRLWAYVQDWFFNHRFLKKVHKSCDSIGLNFYHYVKYGDRPSYKKSDMGWEIAPEGIYNALMTLKRYQKPIFISEAGIADHDDSDRAEYIIKQVEATRRAIQDGVDVRGHLYWSLLDNYEWALGFEKRFGLVEIDYATLERKIRPSAYVYKDIIKNSGVVEYR